MPIQNLAQDVYAAVEGELGVTVGLIQTGEGLVVLDTTIAPSDIETVLDHAGFSVGDVSLVVNSHFHSDHTWGNQLFECPILAHDLCRARMVENLSGPWRDSERAAWIEEVGQGDPAWAETARRKWSGLRITLPTDTFTTGRTVELGGLKMELIHFGGHTPGLTVVWLPESGVLFASDLLFIGRYPFMGDCIVPDWIDALDRLLAFDARVVVPGHGPLCGAPEIAALRAYLADSWSLTGEHLARGHSVEDAVADPAYPVYAAGQTDRHEMNIKIMYQKMVEAG